MKFLEDAQQLIDAGSYQEALDILDNRIKCGPEISKSRLSHYYATRSLCYAHLGNVAESMRDYQLILSFKNESRSVENMISSRDIS